MKIQNIILLMIGSIVITAGGIFFGYSLTQVDEPEDDAPRRTQQAQSANENEGLAVSDGNLIGQPSNPQSQVLGSTGSQTSNTQPQELPGPENFEVYEEYIDSESALYADIEIGEGEEIQAGDTVSVAYTGWLTDGTPFDAAPASQPFKFTIGQRQVIRGWEEGIPGMKIGGIRRLILPPGVAYGSEGQGSIPPNAMLVFDVEAVLLEPRQPGL